MILVVEAWILSIAGWAWFSVQEPWMPSPLAAFVFYGFLVLTTFHLLLVALFAEERGPRIAYFNMVLAMTVFCIGCIADTFQTHAFGTIPAQPLSDNVTRVCCVNCDMPRYHRALFFSGSRLFQLPAGVLIGYLLVHLLLAGGQMLAGSPRSVWAGGAWSQTLAILLACRFIVLFDMSGSVQQARGMQTLVVPDMVFYLLVFSQPLLSLSFLYWLGMLVFLVLLLSEGIPTMGLVGIKIVRSVQFGLILGFTVLSSVELWEGGMLTVPLLSTMGVTVTASGVAMLEAYLGMTPRDAERAGFLGGEIGGYARRPPVSTPLPRPHAPFGPPLPRQDMRGVIPVPVQMQRGKKAV
jgi:hypothetical protein